MNWVTALIETAPTAALFVAGTGFGHLLTRLWQEARSYGRMREIDLLKWERGQLMDQVQKLLVVPSPDGIATTAPKADRRAGRSY